MPLTTEQIVESAQRLHQAELARRQVRKTADLHPGLSMDDAYAIQRATRALKEAEGVTIPGYKIGLTSPVKIRQQGSTEPLYGFLVDYGPIEDRGTVPLEQLIHPRIEMEFAFVLRDALRGAHCDIETVLAATAYVSPAMEIIDSRYETSSFDIASGVADNMSTARYVLGSTRLDPRAADWPLVAAVMEKNGEVTGTGAGAAVMGHPAAALAWLVRKLWQTHGEGIGAGSVVLTGGISDAIPVKAGDRIVARFSGMGTVSCDFA
ncbi:MAG: 2-keto-4-pentenoate hydratase [Janthinobacterium lividum]